MSNTATHNRIVFTRDDWFKKANELFGPDQKLWKFKCPQCGGIQTLNDFIEARVTEPGNKFYFSCIGRWVKGRGCDWTLGGLFQIHKIEVLVEGRNIPVFEFSEPEPSIT